MFYIGMITHPELNGKIDVMISLAPVASLAHLKSPVKVLAPFVKQIQVEIIFKSENRAKLNNETVFIKTFLMCTGTRAFLASDSWTRQFQRIVCRGNGTSTTNRLCQNALYFVTGADTRNFSPVHSETFNYIFML